MNPRERYAALCASMVREEELLAVPKEWPELELQAHWFAGDFGREFHTLSGQSVRIVQFGIWNREAGPDFAEAAVSFDGGEPVRGCIELDPDVRDWERHGHAVNPAYKGVVLHVFVHRGGAESFTRTTENRLVPQIQIDPATLGAERSEVAAAHAGRCSAPLSGMEEDRAREVLLGAAQFRLARKGAALLRLTEAHGPDEALYQALAATLGYKSNKLPFTLLAQRLPLRLVREPGNAGLLFGVSGFLPHDLAAFDTPTRSYLRQLWEQWWPRRAQYERLAIAPHLWKMSGQRPVNHPQRRLAALGQLVHHWPTIRGLRDRCDPGEIQDFFAKLTDDYWDFHYTVTSKESARRMALVGESRVVEMLANVFFPLAVVQDETRWIGFKNLRAVQTNQRAEVAALRLFGNSPRGREFLKSVALQQGLLQIYEDFCLRDATDCARCPFPHQLTQWSNY